MKTPIAAKLLLGLLYLLCVGDVLAMALLPTRFDYLLAFFYALYPPHLYVPMLVVLWAVGLIGLWILVEMIRMVRTVGENPFVRRNVSALRRIGIAAVLAAAVFFAKCLFHRTLLTALCVFVLLVACLFAFTLAHLFDRAVEFKQENDLTI